MTAANAVTPRLLELAGEVQNLRRAGEDADGQDGGAVPGGRRDTTGVLDSSVRVAVLDHHRSSDFHAILEVRRPWPRTVPASRLGPSSSG